VDKLAELMMMSIYCTVEVQYSDARRVIKDLQARSNNLNWALGFMMLLFPYLVVRS